MISTTAPTALLFDEDPASADTFEAVLKETGFQVQRGEPGKPLDATHDDAFLEATLLVCSVSYPMAEGSPETACSSLADMLLAALPLQPMILVGNSTNPPTSENTPNQAVVAQMARPVSAEDAREAIGRAMRHHEMLEEAIARRTFRHQNDYIEEPVARVIHDLNNHLTGLKGGFELILYSLDKLNNQEDRQTVQKYLDQFVSPSLNNIERMISSWRRLRNINQPTDQPVDFVAACRQAAHRTLAPGRRTRLVLEVEGKSLSPFNTSDADPPKPILVMADHDLLTRAFCYILQNAAEAVQDQQDGAISMRIGRHNEEEYAATIHDTGPGIPQDERALVCKSFYTTKNLPHIGMGLALAKQIIDKRQGTLICEDSPLGGAAVQVRFPIYEPQQER